MKGRERRRRLKSIESSKKEFVLDRCSDADLSTWKKIDARLTEFQIRIFYHFEALRATKRQELLDALQHVAPVDQNINGWARVVTYQYSLMPLSSRGSITGIGGRFNYGQDLDVTTLPLFNALYIASDVDTAYCEYFGKQRVNGLSGFELSLQDEDSFSTFMLEGQVVNLFDLTNTKNLNPFIDIAKNFVLESELKAMATELHIELPCQNCTASELKDYFMSSNWRYLPVQFGIPFYSQVFGELLKTAGFDGVLYPSDKGDGQCIAIFVENLENSDTHIHIKGNPPADTVNTILDSSTWKDLI